MAAIKAEREKRRLRAEAATPPLFVMPLHAKQQLAFDSDATEILYGGAAGGGKSYLMRRAAIAWCAEIPGLQVYLFRRIRDDLIKNHMEGPKGFRALLAEWVRTKFATIVEDEIRFWNGSRIYLCHCKDEKDRYKYQGAEIHVLLVDELTHFTETIYRFLRGRVRMVGITLPEQYQGRFPRIISGANPGGVGHQFVKATFIDDVLPLEVRETEPAEGGMLRQFIPAMLEDNPSMATDDPTYENKLLGLGSEALVRALRHGDWDVVEGAFFTEWSGLRHVLPPFELPDDWTRFRSADWGSAKPFSVGWWAIAGDEIRHPTTGQRIPRGAIIRYREWYGCVPGQPNTGLKLTAEQVGTGIKEREAKDPDTLKGGVIDPATFAEDGGPSIASRINSSGGITLRAADNKRVSQRGAMGGWDMMRQRLVGEPAEPGTLGAAMIFCFSTCRDSIRTIPALQHDELRPEDLDTDMEDHAADDWRYACMSRPWVRPKDPPEKKQRTDYVASKSTAKPDDWMTA